jgi:hypothetical protein
MTSWYAPLAAIESKGSQAERPGSLAGLSAARAVHEGQFFTPQAVVATLWRLVSPAIEAYLAQGNHGERWVNLFDNSVGSGRLLQFATPDRFSLYGVDTDGPTVSALGRVAQNAGFTCTFEKTGMENLDPDGMHIALINPPFSLHLESPHLTAFPCTSYGRFGPHTATVSHAYALAQAVAGSEVVVALLPSSFAADVVAGAEDYVDEQDAGRLLARIALPSGTFREENTEVSVSLLVFGGENRVGPVIDVSISDLSDALPSLPLRLFRHSGSAKLRVRGVEDSGPSITLPVTGDKTVRIGHSGRKLGLKFLCGLTEARVRNAILRARLPAVPTGGSPRPKGVKYEGQGALDLEVHLAQPDPVASLTGLLELIRKAGGRPDVDAGLFPYLRRATRRTARQKAALRRTVYIPNGAIVGGDTVQACARRTRPADRSAWISPVFQEGESFQFRRAPDGRFSFQVGGKDFWITAEELAQDFAGETSTAGWTTVHEGLSAEFPELFSSLSQRARSLGIDQWVDWCFQFHDLIECCLKPRGAIVAWQMGLGKARVGAALILLRGVRHGLLVTEAGLVPEIRAELDGLPIDKALWQVIEKTEDTRSLRTINIISYERLRMAVAPGANRTYADLLRRRCGVLVSDEGSVLANPESDRSRALTKVSAGRRYTLTGTLAPNYPHDVVPILAFTTGDGTAAQPWGWRNGHLTPDWLQSMYAAVRGKEAVRDQYCVFEWVTREFEDTLLDGAKRIIPSIRNVAGYRTMLAGHVKRRLQAEPDVRQHVRIEPPQSDVHTIDWDDRHFAFYLAVAEDFADWYRNAFKGSRGNNLAVILKHIRAVSYATDFPQHGVDGFGSYSGWTSKQRWVLDRAESLAVDGKKSIVYAEHPALLEMFHAELARRGVPALPFHGGQTIRGRTRRLNDRFRNGEDMVLLASLGVTQRGLNLPQAHHGILSSRLWLSTNEQQAIYRMCRPQQREKVIADFPHLPGSLDIYKAQAVAFKADAMRAGLDWGEPQMAEDEFLHLTTVIYRFVQDFAKLRAVEPSRLREHLKSAGAISTNANTEVCFA